MLSSTKEIAKPIFVILTVIVCSVNNDHDSKRIYENEIVEKCFQMILIN